MFFTYIVLYLKILKMIKDFLPGVVKNKHFYGFSFLLFHNLCIICPVFFQPSQPINYHFQQNDVTNVSNDQIIVDDEDEQRPSSFSEGESLPRE